MFLTVHSAIGITAVTALGIQDPTAAFAIGWALHYLGDAVPHGDEFIGEWVMRGRSPVLRAIPFFVADFLAMAAAFTVVAFTGGWHWNLLAAAAGSIVPDALFGIEMVFRRKLFGPLSDLHERAHGALNVRLPLRYGMPFQLALVAVLWFGLAA